MSHHEKNNKKKNEHNYTSVRVNKNEGANIHICRTNANSLQETSEHSDISKRSYELELTNRQTYNKRKQATS